MLKVSFKNISRICKTSIQTQAPTQNMGQTLGVGTVSLSATDLLSSYIDKMQQISSYNIIEKYRFKKFIKKLIPQIIKCENYINEGKDSKVYRINDKYVAKVAKSCKFENLIRFYHITSCPNNLFKNIEMYYGQPIVEVGRVEILKNAMPTKNSVVCGLSFDKKVLSPEEIRDYETKFLKYCSSLPQESFDKFALGLKNLNNLSHKMAYTVDDFNPNNVIIADGQFKIIDRIAPTNNAFLNSVYTMLKPLLLKISAYVEATPNSDVTIYRRIIYSKCMKAAQKVNLEMFNAPILKERYDKALKSILEVEELPNW